MAVTTKPDTGHGFTLTFATTNWTGKIIGLPTNLVKTRERVKATHLASATNHEYIPGDLDELGELEVDVRFEAATGLPATGSAPETITATWPLAPGGGGATGGSLAGTGFITGTTYPPMQTGVLQTGKIRFTFNGGTGPTWTAEA